MATMDEIAVQSVGLALERSMPVSVVAAVGEEANWNQVHSAECFWCGFKDTITHMHRHLFNDHVGMNYECYLCGRRFVEPYGKRWDVADSNIG